MNLDFTLLDVIVVLTILVSTGYAIYRGFVNETLSVFAWAAAAFAALYFAPAIAPFLRARMPTPLIGSIVAYAGVFFVVLVPLSFISYRFSENVKNSPVGPADRVLGFVFGVARGLAVIGIAYIIFSLFVPLRDHPRWIREARFLPLVQESSDVLLTLLPNQHPRESEDREVRDAEGGPPPVEHRLSRHGHKSYGAADRRALDRLIEATGSGSDKP